MPQRPQHGRLALETLERLPVAANPRVEQLDGDRSIGRTVAREIRVAERAVTEWADELVLPRDNRRITRLLAHHGCSCVSASSSTDHGCRTDPLPHTISNVARDVVGCSSAATNASATS